jgi:hypothetical protein
MTALSQEDRDWLRKSRAASGVPENVTDQHAINQVATLVLNSETLMPRKRAS